MGDVVDFQRARGEKFLARMRELNDAGHVPDASLTIAMHEFGLEPIPRSPIKPEFVAAVVSLYLDAENDDGD